MHASSHYDSQRYDEQVYRLFGQFSLQLSSPSLEAVCHFWTRTIAQANQYDKAEELITWNTFAPLLKMDRVARDSTASAIIAKGLDGDVSEYLDDEGLRLHFEYTIPAPRSYLENGRLIKGSVTSLLARALTFRLARVARYSSCWIA